MESGVFQREDGEEREQGAGPEERDWAADDAAPSSSQWSPGMGTRHRFDDRRRCLFPHLGHLTANGRAAG